MSFETQTKKQNAYQILPIKASLMIPRIQDLFSVEKHNP